MTSFIEFVRMTLGGYGPSHVKPGKIVRFATNDRRGDLAGWARLFDDGEGGAFGCFRSGISETWQSRKPHSEADRQIWLETVRRNRERSERELVQLRTECRLKSAKLWDLARDPDPQHPYLIKKGIKPYGAKQLRNSLIIPVRSSEGELCGVQFIFPDSAKKFKTGTETVGSYHSIGKLKGKTILICEGWVTGCTLHAASAYAVVVAFSAGNLLPVCKILRKKYPDWKLIVCSDDDYKTSGNPGLTKAIEAARAVGALLAIPEFTGTRGDKDTDFNDMEQQTGSDAVRRIIESACEPPANVSAASGKFVLGESAGEAAESGLPLLFDDVQTQDISPDLLPGWLGAYAAAVAQSTQTPTAMSVMLALSAVATCTAKRFEVAPYGDGYHEPLNLWTASVLPPASRKTAVVSAMTGPLIEWEQIEAERLGPEIRRTLISRRALEKRKEKLEKSAARVDDAARHDALLREIEQLEENMPDELLAARLWTGDTTPERLQSLLADHGERMAVLSDEGGIFEVMSGLYSGGRANLDIFLQGHAGQAVRVDRQGRTAHLSAPALSFGLAVQPAVLADMTCGSKNRFRGKGTLARFLYAVPRSNIGCRDVRATFHIPATVSAQYRAGLFNLLAITPQIVEGKEVPRRLTLTPEALVLWQSFAEMVEKRQGDGGDLESIQDWSGKLPGAVLRIAGNFHLVEHGGDPPVQIESVIIKRSADLCTLLIDHAKLAFAMMDVDPATDDAKALLRWVISEGSGRFTRGEAYRQFKGRFTGKTERLDKALKELLARQIIASVTEITPGRPATVFIVSPKL